MTVIEAMLLAIIVSATVVEVAVVYVCVSAIVDWLLDE